MAMDMDPLSKQTNAIVINNVSTNILHSSSCSNQHHKCPLLLGKTTTKNYPCIAK
jgi:hypothetical protein